MGFECESSVSSYEYLHPLLPEENGMHHGTVGPSPATWSLQCSKRAGKPCSPVLIASLLNNSLAGQKSFLARGFFWKKRRKQLLQTFYFPHSIDYFEFRSIGVNVRHGSVFPFACMLIGCDSVVCFSLLRISVFQYLFLACSSFQKTQLRQDVICGAPNASYVVSQCSSFQVVFLHTKWSQRV